MPRIEVGRYKHDVGFKGWVSAPGWVVFYRNDGALMAYHADKRTGAVIGEPAILTP